MHGNTRGPVAPVHDERYPNGGLLPRGASWGVELDAGSAFVVWLIGPDEWITNYVLTLPEACAALTLEEFSENLTLAAVDGNEYAAAVLAALDVDTVESVAPALAEAPSGMRVEYLTDADIEERGLTP